MSGLYIHIPFCRQKCSYCDFHFSTTFESYRDKMIESICREIRLRKDYLPEKKLNSIYFGGGTPSILNKVELEKIFQSINEHFQFNNPIEITIEVNPEDINEELLSSWKLLGINRLSLGVQSFKDEDLKWMNRSHSVQDAITSIEMIRKAGFENISADLIYGLPELSIGDWKEHLSELVNLDIPHISAYCLTVENKTALKKWIEQKKIAPASEDAQSDQFEFMISYLEQNGYEQYEISNFAKKGRYAIHNTSYWQGIPYLGIGPSAHSFSGNERRWNIANNSVYISSVGENANWYDTEIINEKEQWNERILTGLRTKFGVDLEALSQILPLTKDFELKIEGFIDQQWMIKSTNTIQLTTKGKLRADYIASELFRD